MLGRWRPRHRRRLAEVTTAEGKHRITLGGGDPVEVLEEARSEREPVIFVTELVAFFNAEGFVLNKPPRSKGWSRRRDPFFAFSRTAYGIVRVRTDGVRLLVYTDSGQADLKEAYAYTLDRGRAVPQAIRRA